MLLTSWILSRRPFFDPPPLPEYCYAHDDPVDGNERDLSARAYDPIFKVARTIAHLAHPEQIQSAHLSEAIQHRVSERAFRVEKAKIRNFRFEI